MSKVGWLGVLVAFAAGCSPDYRCGDYVWSSSEHRCVCPPGATETEAGTCLLADGGMLFPPDWDGAVPDGDGGTACPDGRPMRELFEDADGDGYGRASSGAMGCEGTPGRVTNGDDCDDACADCRPGGLEICDGRDNDCANGPDDTFGCVRGAATACATSCGSTGVVACGLDCAVPAGATCTAPAETCNGEDDDCDGLVDEGVLAFGEPVDWMGGQNTGGRWAPDPSGGADVLAPQLRDDGLYVVRLEASGTMRAESPRIAEGDFPVTAIRWLDGEVIVAYVMQGSTSHRLEIRSLSPTTLAPTGTASLVATLSSVPDQLAFGAGLTTTLYYDVGARLYSAVRLVSGAGYTERALIDDVDGPYDIVVPPASIGTAYVLYAAQPRAGDPAPSSQSEIFVQALNAGSTAGQPLRITTNQVPDVAPRAAFHDGRLAIGWLQMSTAGSLEGSVFAAVAAPAESTVGASLRVGPAGIFATPLMVRRGAGWLVTWSGSTLSAAGPFLAAPLDEAISTAGGVARTTAVAYWFTAPGSAVRATDLTLAWPIAFAPADAGEDTDFALRVLTLGCR